MPCGGRRRPADGPCVCGDTPGTVQCSTEDTVCCSIYCTALITVQYSTARISSSFGAWARSIDRVSSCSLETGDYWRLETEPVPERERDSDGDGERDGNCCSCNYMYSKRTVLVQLVQLVQYVPTAPVRACLQCSAVQCSVYYCTYYILHTPYYTLHTPHSIPHPPSTIYST